MQLLQKQLLHCKRAGVENIYTYGGKQVLRVLKIRLKRDFKTFFTNTYKYFNLIQRYIVQYTLTATNLILPVQILISCLTLYGSTLCPIQITIPKTIIVWFDIAFIQ